MNREKTKGLREGAMMVALTIILVLLTYYVPLFSLIGTFACAVPMACLAARNEFKVVIPALFAVFVLSILIIGSVLSSFSITLMSVLPGAIAGYFLGRKKPFFITLFATCLAVCIGWIAELLVVNFLISGNGIEEMIAELTVQMQEAMNLVLSKIPQNAESALNINDEAKMLINNVVNTFRLYFPSLVIICSMIIGYIIIMFSAFVLQRTNTKDINVLKFSMLKAPRSMSTVTVLVYVVFALTDGETVFGGVLANAIFILYTIIGICGLSLVDSFFSKKIKSFVVRIIIYLAIFMFGGVLMTFVPVALVVAGMFDSIHDYRKLGYENEGF